MPSAESQSGSHILQTLLGLQEAWSCSSMGIAQHRLVGDMLLDKSKLTLTLTLTLAHDCDILSTAF